MAGVGLAIDASGIFIFSIFYMKGGGNEKAETDHRKKKIVAHD